MRAFVTLASIVVLLGACQTGGPRTPRDETKLSPDFDAASIVDIAVIRPGIAARDEERLSEVVREEIRRYLIDAKAYSVPSLAFLREVADGASDPSAAARSANSDAALVLRVDQWDTRNLLGKSRIYAGGLLQLHHPEGGHIYSREFSDLTLVSSLGSVTPSNRFEAEDAMARDLVRILLASLPSKPIR